MAARGALRIYLGAAPGVGKTFAMLDEGWRRLERGTDVVVAFVETHGRPHTAEQLDGLPVVPAKSVSHRGAALAELDLSAVLARRPEVALVDDLAHTNVSGSGPHDKRWQDVAALLEAGIDVISTVNVQNLESLNDVVEQITGIPQRETVPDTVVRSAEQVELVDMTPEALRRRMAHGNICPPEQIDAATRNYFRDGNLSALRELALLWVADRVEDGLQRYRIQHGISVPWETRERILVALTGGPESEALIRRAGRIAARSALADPTAGRDGAAERAELIAVHVSRGDGLRGGNVASLQSYRALVESLGGTYHSVIGTDVPNAILEFARSVGATQIVLGASRKRPWFGVIGGPGTGQTVIRLSGPIDVHIVSHDYTRRSFALPALGLGLSIRRRLIALAAAAALLALATGLLSLVRAHLNFSSDLAAYLLIVVITALVGGFWPAVATAVASGLLLNWYFAEPIHTLTVSATDNIVAIAIFLIVAALVSQVVDRAARLQAFATRRGAEAETLAALASSLLRGEQAIPALLARVQETFVMQSVSLLQRESEGPLSTWTMIDGVGSEPPQTPGDGDASAEIGHGRALVLSGRPLAADDQRMLTAFAAEVAVAYQQRQLAETTKAVESLNASERARTALLNAVSHDLRTPLASAKAAVSGLRASDVRWSEADRRELLANADDALDRLTDLVTNLLDLSRLQAGVMPTLLAPVGLEDIVARVLDQLRPTPDAVAIQVPLELPYVTADAVMLERVLANLVQNALRYSPAASPVRIVGTAVVGRVELRVIDNGPGIPPDAADAVFQSFQRAHDVPSDGTGVGLGLAIARGFTEAMHGTVRVEPTPGGGATFVVTLEEAAT
jgi:two-component system sensor histidine kinase KdpD